MVRTSGSRDHAAVAPPGPAEKVWVSSLIRRTPSPAGDLADALQVAGLGQHDPDVGEGGLHQDGGHVPVGELPLQALQVVELRDAAGQRDVARCADVAGTAGATAAAGAGDDQGLVDAAVVAVAVEEDLLPSGDGAGQADGPPVGVGRRQRVRPAGQPEAAGEFGADPLGVLGGEHRGGAALLAVAPLDRLGDGLRGVVGHGAGVAEAKSTYSWPSMSVTRAPRAPAR